VSYAKEDPASPNPVFKTLDDWEKKKSTKMDACAQICKHYLHHDDVGDVEFHDGQLVFPHKGGFHPKTQGHKRKRKILIYSEFPSLTSLLKNVRWQFIICISTS